MDQISIFMKKMLNVSLFEQPSWQVGAWEMDAHKNITKSKTLRGRAVTFFQGSEQQYESWLA